MREIKFRAWDKEQKQMMYGGQVHFSLPLSLNVFKFHQTSIHKTPFDYHELMQFTGLLDKNGKEIYEGDILEEKSFTNEVIALYIVVWQQMGFVYKKDSNSPDSYYANSERIEIKGNKFENPELL